MTQPPEPPPPPDDAWPTPDDPTLISSRETVVGAPPPEPVGPPPDRRIGAGMLLALGALALVALGILIAWYLTHRDDDNKGSTTVTTVQTTTAAGEVVVPVLIGKPFTEAQATLDAAGLHTSKRPVSSNRRAGTVIDQTPAAGASVAKGSTVTISVASATTSSTSSTSTAATTTTATTTESTTTSTTTSAAPPPQPTTATMPDVKGQTEQAAVTSMSNAGILPSLVFVPGQDTLGTVVQQAKPANTTVPFHAHVQINVSKGPNATTDETVPNAVGQTLDQAVSTMNGAHLRLIYVKFPVTSQSQVGKIVQQSPLRGAKAPQNAQVLVYLGALQKQ